MFVTHIIIIIINIIKSLKNLLTSLLRKSEEEGCMSVDANANDGGSDER